MHTLALIVIRSTFLRHYEEKKKAWKQLIIKEANTRGKFPPRASTPSRTPSSVTTPYNTNGRAAFQSHTKLSIQYRSVCTVNTMKESSLIIKYGVYFYTYSGMRRYSPVGANSRGYGCTYLLCVRVNTR
jgi:hypothetical protein